LTSGEEIARWYSERRMSFGRIDVLVNSAANFLPSSVISTTEEIWDASLDTNVKGPFSGAGCSAVVRRSNGAIVNFADTGGILGCRDTLRIRFESRNDHVDETLAKSLRQKCA